MRGQIVVPVLLRRGRGSGVVTPPIITGDYIWYSYDPVDGYGLDENGDNIVLDKGINLLTPRADGKYDGDIYAGNHIYLNGTDQSVPYPDAQTHNSYYEVATKTRIQQVATGTTYDMTVSHSDYATHTKALTVNELAECNADPQAMSDVWFKGRVLVDGFSKSDMVNYFQGNEGVNGGAYVQDLSIPLSTLDIATVFSPITTGGVVSTETGSSCDGSGTTTGQIRIAYDTADATPYTPFLVSFDVSNLTGATKINSYYDGTVYVPVEVPIKNGKIEFIAEQRNEASYFMFRIDADTVWSFDYSNPVAFEIIGYAEIQNYTPECRTTYLNTKHGLNNTRLLRDASGRTELAIDTRLARFDGSGQAIDTKVAIDGSLTDFTMMMAFTLPEVSSPVTYIANSAGDVNSNRLSIMHEDGSPINELRAQIGKFASTMTFDEANPIHAMVAVFNQATSELQIAIDGDTLSAPFPIVFDGVTGTVLFGALNTGGTGSVTGYIGEGVLSADMLDESAWQEFWARVKDTQLPVFDGGLFVNGGFEDGIEGWIVTGGWHGTVGANTATNDGGVNDMMFQNFTLEDGATYEISADKLSGDAVVTFILYDADSGIDITLGAHQFLGDGLARSIGVVINTAGTVDTVCDNLRLVRI